LITWPAIAHTNEEAGKRDIAAIFSCSSLLSSHASGCSLLQTTGVDGRPTRHGLAQLMHEVATHLDSTSLITGLKEKGACVN
jgi:hypothetical protein